VEITPITPDIQPAEPVAPVSDRPQPFRLADRYEWIAADDPGLSGLAIYVRTSITNLERDRLQERHDDILEYNRDWLAMPAPERPDGDSPRDREWNLLAPYVKDWNVVGLDVDGNETPLPTPAVAGGKVFEACTPDVTNWIMRVVLLGYRATGKADGWKPLSTATSGPQIAPSAE